MDVATTLRQRLEDLGLDQRDLARAAGITESYVSQILTRKKAPPAPERTDIYDRMDRFLKLPQGELARIAAAHLREEIKRRLGETAPLFAELRELLLRKCAPAQVEQARGIFERQPFGELERLVAHTLLRAVGGDGEALYVSPKQRRRLETAIASWQWNPATFGIEVAVAASERGKPVSVRRFEFLEQPDTPAGEEKGLRDFLRDPSLSGSATAAELEFLKALRFADRRPTALYYYRELQNLRDPLHFRTP